MEWTSQSAPFSEQISMPADLPQQTVALRDMEIARFRPAECFETSPSDHSPGDFPLNTSHEDSGTASPITYTSDEYPGSSSGEDDDDCTPEPDTLEYARHHGLCREYLMDDPLGPEIVPPLPKSLYHDMNDHPGDPQLDALQSEVMANLNERLDVDKETAVFLRSVLSEGKRFEQDPIEIHLKPTVRRLPKLDLPVLATDHDADILALRRRGQVKLSNSSIEPFQLDPEEDEGMAFPQAEYERKRLLDHKLNHEKLDVSKEAMEFLLDLRQYSKDDQVDYADEAYRSHKKAKAIRLSPPLLPVTPPYSPKDPAPEAMQIHMTSTPEDLIAKDAAAAEKEILEEDQITNAASAGKPDLDPQDIAAAIDSYIAAPSSSSPLARKRRRNLRVEPPLTPRNHTGSSSDGEPKFKRGKSVHLDPEVVALLPELQQTGSSDGLAEYTRQQLKDLQTTMVKAADSIQQQFEDEHLVETDTTLRVKVLQLERVQAQPPWTTCTGVGDPGIGRNAQQTMLKHVNKEFFTDTRKWSGVTKVERSLPWAPFPPYMAKVDLNEQFDDGSLERCLAEMGFGDADDEVDVQAIIARDDHLHSLRGHDSDDEEIDPNGDQDYNSDDAASESEHQPCPQALVVPGNARPDLSDLLRQRQLDFDSVQPSESRLRGHADKPEATSFLTSVPSANLIQHDGIASFMQLQGKPQSVQSVNHHARKAPAVGTVRPSALNPAPAAVMVKHPAPAHAQARTPAQVPVPEMNGTEVTSIPVILSSKSMANRQLLRCLRAKLPNIDLCERDASTGRAQDSTKNNLLEEADVTISPSTGILMTTLQKLKQRPLPGQVSFVGVRDCILSVTARYERLILLVSEGSTEELAPIRTLDERDCEALADLMGWAQLLDSDVQIYYIPGSEQEVATWLAATISHLGVVDDSLQLLQDETMWERWLRRAGLNAFAAQAVLVQLKLPESPLAGEAPASRRFGLAAFVSMGVEERVEQFGSLLGGERVLRNVSETIEKAWSVQRNSTF